MSGSPRSALRGVVFRNVLRTLGTVHRGLYRASGGRIGGRLWGLPVLLLTTTGRKSGRLRTTPLCYLPDGDRCVVIASNGGMDWYPSWWLNLLREPQVTVQIGSSKRNLSAREASPEERARLWAEITTIAPGYLGYERKTRRRIPLGILEPRN